MKYPLLEYNGNGGNKIVLIDLLKDLDNSLSVKIIPFDTSKDNSPFIFLNNGEKKLRLPYMIYSRFRSKLESPNELTEKIDSALEEYKTSTGVRF